MKTTFKILAAIFFGAFLLAGCGADEKKEPADEQKNEQKTSQPQEVQEFNRLVKFSLDLGEKTTTNEAGEEQKTRELFALSRKDLANKDLSFQSDGRAVLFAFFTTWCEPCEVEINMLKALRKKFGENLRIIGVLVEEKSPEQIEEFIAQKRLNFELARGEGSFTFMQVLGGFGGIPYTALYNKDGQNIANFTGLVAQEMLEIEIKRAIK